MALERFRSVLIIAAIGLACFSAFSAGQGDEASVRRLLGELVDSQRTDTSAFYTDDATHIGPPLVIPEGGIDVARIDFIADNVALVDGSIDTAPRQRVFFVLRNYGRGWAIAASLVEPAEAHP
jgi:hypothetical protein